MGRLRAALTTVKNVQLDCYRLLVFLDGYSQTARLRRQSRGVKTNI